MIKKYYYFNDREYFIGSYEGDWCVIDYDDSLYYTLEECIEYRGTYDECINFINANGGVRI